MYYYNNNRPYWRSYTNDNAAPESNSYSPYNPMDYYAVQSTPEPWNPNVSYQGGSYVTYKGKVYKSKWWTQGDVPDKMVANPWETPWQLISGGNVPTPKPTPVPTPKPSPQPVPTPPPPSNVTYPNYSKVNVGKGIKWPKKVFAPFIDATSWPPSSFADDASKTKVPYYNLGFVVSKDSSSFLPSWGTYYAAEDCPISEQIRKIRQMGGDVIVSFGGAANTPLHVTAPNATALKEQYKRFIKAYGLTRIDFDIEGAWVNDTQSLKKNSTALKILQDELKNEHYYLEIWYTLPVLPTGLTPDGLNALKYALDANVTIDGVNVMTMDYGDVVAPNPRGQMGKYGIQAITNLHSQLKNLYSQYGQNKSSSEIWSMIGTTPMIGMNDVTTEIFDLNDARQTLDFAMKNSIGMISMWSYNRDKQCPNGATNYVSISCSSILQKDYEFCSIFNKYNNTSAFKPHGGGSTPGTSNPGFSNEWSSSKVYVGGDKVVYNGHTYEAKWWTQGDVPGQSVSNSWESPWKLIK